MRSLMQLCLTHLSLFPQQQLGAFVNIIFFIHQRSIATWLFKTLDSIDGVSSTTCVTNIDEYLEAARSLRTFSILIGQLQIHEYCIAERILQTEGITPQRRVLNAPILTAEYVQWAIANQLDGVIDFSRRTADVGQVVHAALATSSEAQSISQLPVSGPIAYRDVFDEGIVQAVAIGFTNVEIAEQFNYSLQTVRNRISRILEDSGARNRTHLAAMYLIPLAMNMQSSTACQAPPATNESLIGA